jgi:predicted metallopeptidase
MAHRVRFIESEPLEGLPREIALRTVRRTLEGRNIVRRYVSQSNPSIPDAYIDVILYGILNMSSKRLRLRGEAVGKVTGAETKLQSDKALKAIIRDLRHITSTTRGAARSDEEIGYSVRVVDFGWKMRIRNYLDGILTEGSQD